MEECNTVSTPMDKDVVFEKTDTKEVNKKSPYRELIGSLTYIASSTRPDIAHAVSVLDQFSESHKDIHWTAAKRVLRYLKSTINYSICCRKGESEVLGYVDADWGRCRLDR